MRNLKIVDVKDKVVSTQTEAGIITSVEGRNEAGWRERWYYLNNEKFSVITYWLNGDLGVYWKIMANTKGATIDSAINHVSMTLLS